MSNSQEQCPLATTAKIIGDTTVLLIVRDLLRGPKRFTDLSTSLCHVSTRTITKKLKLLEDEGVIKKEKLVNESTRSQYVLTKKGIGLSAITDAMREYGKKFLDS
jgi:DNA-binding HxlR family transcriptional regulator